MTISILPGGLAEADAIEIILDRADTLARVVRLPGYCRLCLRIDLEMIHSDICRLDLVRLALAPDAAFREQIIGIWEHYDRTSGKFRDGFMPRYVLHMISQ